MSLNDTPSGERVHIGFFGRRNAGKSSLVNAVTGQDLSVVSETKGTTTDPVQKAMELLPIGPVWIIDTPGYDDEGRLGELRVRKTKQILNRTDIAVLVIDSTLGIQSADEELLNLFSEKDIPYLIVFNKADLDHNDVPGGDANHVEDDDDGNDGDAGQVKEDDNENAGDVSQVKDDDNEYDENSVSHNTGYIIRVESSDGNRRSIPVLSVSSLTGLGIHELKEKLAGYGSAGRKPRPLVSDLIRPGDLVMLVIPIDSSAPKGRLILPQQQVIRDILDHDGAAMCVKENDLPGMLSKLASPPALVITDSQVFARVAEDIPESIPLTSFSILMARYKGMLDMALSGVHAIDSLKDGDRILIAEGCTHHRQCEDIGTVKIPAWLASRTGRRLVIETCSGRDFPEDLTPYSLIIHCGGCMLNEREVLYRMKCAGDQGVPITNYGTAIALMKGILDRSTRILN